MSSWSSFKEDKAIVDKWRSFLQERQYSQEEIDKLSNLLVPALQTYAEAPREQRQQMLNQIDQYIEMLKNKGIPEEAVAAAVEDAKKEVADEHAAAVEDTEEEVEDQQKDVYIFRGKRGKGIQSQLAKAGIDSKILNTILKALATDLKNAGFNVLEEKKSRRIIDAPETIKALSTIGDGPDKDKIIRVIVKLLRSNKIKLNPEDSQKLLKKSSDEEAVSDPPTPDEAALAEPEPEPESTPEIVQEPEEADREEGGSPGEEEKPEEPNEPQVIKVPVLVRFDDDDIKYYRLNNNVLRSAEARKEADQILTDLENSTLIGRNDLQENVRFSELFELASFPVYDNSVIEEEEDGVLDPAPDRREPGRSGGGISTDDFENKFGRGKRMPDIKSLKRANRRRKRGDKIYEPVYYYVFDKSILNDMEAAAPGAKANHFVSRVTRKIIAFLKDKGLQQISPKQAKALMTRAGGGGTGMKGINHAKAIKILQKYKVVAPDELTESIIFERWQLIAGIKKVL